jgi:hypothetical protein
MPSLPWAYRALGAAVVILSLLGCASGPITAELTQRGRPGGSLVMSWKSGLFGESGTIAARLPNGERLSGKYLVVSPGLTREKIGTVWPEAAMPWDDRSTFDEDPWTIGPSLLDFHASHTNKAVAKLEGDRGTTMLCRFTLNAGESGMGGGGSGTCKDSTGGKIAARF